MKLVFFGTPEFAVPTLEILLKRATVLAVVTQPDRPAGRGGKLTASPVKLLAQTANVPIYQPEKLRKDEAVLSNLEALGADFFVVVAYGQILSKRVLAMPRLGCINVHGSLLPHYRGAAPVQWAIYYGEPLVGITTMLMDTGLDTGAMLLKARLPITEDTQSVSLLQSLAPIGAELLWQTLTTFSDLIPEAQADQHSSYAPLIKPEHLLINWQTSALQLQRQIRAFYPQVHTAHRTQRLKILASHVSAELSTDVPAGTVTQLIRNQGFQVNTSDGQLLITQVHPPGKRAQSAWDYVHGSRMEVGERL